MRSGTASTGMDLPAISSYNGFGSGQYAYTGGTHFVATYIGINDEGYLTETPDLSEFTKNGFSMVSIYERSPNSLSYFTGNTNGISNAEYGAKGSIQAAQKAGQKVGTGAIYFTVDYDPPKDLGRKWTSEELTAIDHYFRGIKVANLIILGFRSLLGALRVLLRKIWTSSIPAR